MGSPVNITEGCSVWVQDPEIVWIDGQVKKIEGDDVVVQTCDEREVATKLSKIHPKDGDAPAGGVDDMTRLSYLHEPGVLYNLETRYLLNKIYTYTGSILIAVNPFQTPPDMYETHIMEKYKGVPRGELPPHVFAIADIAYRAMINDGKSNSILVSGESGAGKTETTKMLMQYLAYLGGHKAVGKRTVEDQVLESNPVLEAFGNAKTVRNDNSSRFGKFVEMQFDRRGRISGAAIRTYLLEKSRVCQVSDPERNYHCFYYLCAAPQEDIEKYKLGSPTTFHYLNQSSCYELDGVSDAQQYLVTKKAMDVVGISQDEQEAIFRIVAAILHLGNVTFCKDGETEKSALENDNSKFHLQTSAELLKCSNDALEDALLRRAMVTPEEVIKKSLDPDGAVVSRDGLARTLYSRLFDWLVDKINFIIGQDANSKCLIGILDIYGFESFKNNSFEQFCINLTNEKLQQHFNQHIFKMQQTEYAKEEIEWSYVDFVDNQDVLDLIEKKPGGIIALLDETCMFPKATALTFSEKLYQTFKSHKRFIKPKLARTEFTIAHYAGEVQYQSDQFMDKNKDYVVPEHQDLLTASECPFVSALFPPITEETSKSSNKCSKFSSIASRFRLQLHQLMETLNSTEPHYIRCVKPNNQFKPGLFENSNVSHQLCCGGVLEAIRISCSGYPTHKTFSEFLSRFRLLVPDVLEANQDERDACIKILDKMGISGAQIGKTKVFLRAGEMAKLDASRLIKLGDAVKIVQRKARGYIARKNFVNIQEAALSMQAICRGIAARRTYSNLIVNLATLRIQKSLRGLLGRREFTKFKDSIIVLQTGMRLLGAHIIHRYKKQSKEAIVIQAYWRRHRGHSHYKRLMEVVVEIQCGLRGMLARRELRKLKMADLGKSNGEERTESGESLEAMEPKVEETDTQCLEKCKDNQETIEEASSTIEEPVLPVGDKEKIEALTSEVATVLPVGDKENIEALTSKVAPVLPVGDKEKIEALTSEVANLKKLLRSEKDRAEKMEKLYTEALESAEGKRRKLEETERRVRQLQESLNRMISTMSDQFSELKMVLCPSNSSCASGFTAGDHMDDDSSSTASSDSDFTFPTPASTPQNFATFTPDAFRLIVQDLSAAEVSGTENWEREREGAFDDFF